MLGYEIIQVASSQISYIIWSPLLVFEQDLHEEYSLIQDNSPFLVMEKESSQKLFRSYMNNASNFTNIHKIKFTSGWNKNGEWNNPTSPHSKILFGFPLLLLGEKSSVKQFLSSSELKEILFLILLGFVKYHLVSTDVNRENKIMQLAWTQIFYITWSPLHFCRELKLNEAVLMLFRTCLKNNFNFTGFGDKILRIKWFK